MRGWFCLLKQPREGLNKIIYYVAELVRAEKELSDWFPEWSEFSYTER